MKVYHIHCNGFEAYRDTIEEVQTYIDWLRTMWFNIGQSVAVTVGERDKHGVTFHPGRATRRELLTARAA